MAPDVVKFSDTDCGTCHRMSKLDEAVCQELEMTFIKVSMQDIDSYANYRHVLLKEYPDLEGIGFPTYIVVDDASSLDCEVKGVIRGGMDKGAFRKKLQAFL